VNLPATPAVSALRRRRTVKNRAARALQWERRSHVSASIDEARAAGLSLRCAAAVAQISTRTWHVWQQWRGDGKPCLPLRGRPPRCATLDERRRACDFLQEHGSHVPLRAIRDHLPSVARAELADLKRRYRKICRWRWERHQGRLVWHRPGSVWALDFTEPATYINGTDRWILSVRDLGSRDQLVWRSFRVATAEAVVEVLVALFIEHGPPLVIKSDNGSQFIAQVTLAALSAWQVVALFSPPRRPRYNGGIERPHPLLKGYTAAAAQRAGRADAPQSEDLESGRQTANRFTRPHGENGPTAEQLWEARTPIDSEERMRFLASVEANRARCRSHRGYAPDTTLNHYQQAAVDREAVRDALVEHRLLTIARRRKRKARRAADRGPDEKIFTRSAPHAAPASGTITAKPRLPALPQAAPQRDGPTDVEPDHTRVERRLITPVLNGLRSAKIR
jgi:hypothetical protein